MKRRAETDASNRMAAAAILENPVRYGGEGAGLVQWARLVNSAQPQVATGGTR